MDNQRGISKKLFDESKIEATPMNWHIWKRAFDLGVEAKESDLLHDVSNSFFGSDYHPIKFKEPKHDEKCYTVNEVGQKSICTYKIMPRGWGLFLKDESDETYNCKVIAWKTYDC